MVNMVKDCGYAGQPTIIDGLDALPPSGPRFLHPPQAPRRPTRPPGARNCAAEADVGNLKAIPHRTLAGRRPCHEAGFHACLKCLTRRHAGAVGYWSDRYYGLRRWQQASTPSGPRAALRSGRGSETNASPTAFTDTLGVLCAPRHLGGCLSFRRPNRAYSSWLTAYGLRLTASARFSPPAAANFRHRRAGNLPRPHS